MTFRSTQNLSI